MPMSPGLLAMQYGAGQGMDPRDPRARRAPFNPYPQAPAAPLVQPRPVDYLAGVSPADAAKQEGMVGGQDPMALMTQMARSRELERKRRLAAGLPAEEAGGFNPAGVSPWMSMLGGLGLGGGGGGGS